MDLERIIYTKCVIRVFCLLKAVHGLDFACGADLFRGRSCLRARCSSVKSYRERIL